LETFNEEAALPLRVLNVIGYGFDEPNQPDAIHFRALNEKAGQKLFESIRGVFEKILACVRYFKGSDQPITWMHLPEFGCGAFAGERAHEVKDIWQACWDEFVPLFKAEDCTADRGYIYTDGDFFANNLRFYTTWQYYAQRPDVHGGIANRLFVNAWDPHSIVGNGNFTDASMDGYYGRTTAMALLCWPPTNPAVNAQLIKVEPVEQS